jgi:hypothetical protein
MYLLNNQRGNGINSLKAKGQIHIIWKCNIYMEVCILTQKEISVYKVISNTKILSIDPHSWLYCTGTFGQFTSGQGSHAGSGCPHPHPHPVNSLWSQWEQMVIMAEEWAMCYEDCRQRTWALHKRKGPEAYRPPTQEVVLQRMSKNWPVKVSGGMSDREQCQGEVYRELEGEVGLS